MDEAKVGSAEPTQAVSDTVVEATQKATEVSDSAQNKDSVAYETYRRTLSEAKRVKAERDELRERAALLEQQKLESEGNKDELINTLKKQLAEKEKRYKDSVGNYAYQSVKSQIESEAAKLGCVDTDALSKLVNLDVLDIDETTFRAEAEQVKLLIDEVKNQRPYLFSKAGPKLDPHVPRTGDLRTTPLDPLKMSKDELIASIKALDAKQK